MFKNILSGILFCGILNLSAFAKDSTIESLKKLQSFSANFTQTLSSNDGNKKQTITYKGEIKALAPAFVLWSYKSPIPKEIYINKQEMIIYEPKLKQAIVAQMDENLDLLNLLKSAEVVDSNHLRAQVLDQSYNLFLKNGALSEISFVDSLGNEVKIIFSDVVINEPIDDRIFEFRPNSEVDIIYP